MKASAISGGLTVAVVGGGVAGLTAAWDLQRAGHRAIVLDQGDMPGGRCRDIVHDGLTMRSGARLFYSFYATVMDLIDELGLRPEMVKLGHSDMWCDDGARRYPVSFGPSPALLLGHVVPVVERLRLLSLVPDLASARLRGDPDDLASLLGHDDCNLAAYLADKGLARFGEAVVQPLFRGARNWNIQDITPAFFLLTTAAMIGHFAFTFREGVGFFTRSLASRLTVSTNVRVTRIAETAHGVQVSAIDAEGRSQTLDADLAICAVEGAVVRPLLADPAHEVAAFLDAVRYNSLGVSYGIAEGAVAPNLTFLGSKHSSGLAIVEALPGSSAPEEPARFFCELAPETVAAVAASGSAGFERHAASYLSLKGHKIQRWVNQWIPAMLPVPYLGYARRMAAFRSWQAAQARRIYLAGDYLATPLVGGACASGRATARLIEAHWTGPRSLVPVSSSERRAYAC